MGAVEASDRRILLRDYAFRRRVNDLVENVDAQHFADDESTAMR